jgi:hypothetical protein
MEVKHLVIPPPARDEADLIVTSADGVLTVHEFDGKGTEAHTCIPDELAGMHLWASWVSNARAYFVD